MADLEIVWPPPIKFPPLAPDQAHVWAIALNQPPEKISALAQHLSADEQTRAARFHSECDRQRFIVGRGSLRVVLGQYLGEPPGQLIFDYGPRGKPMLARRDDHPAPRFNLAHSHDLALLAVASHHAVGIDVERIRRINDVQAIAARFFSPRESDGLRAQSPKPKETAFFNLWTRKEAWLKATGEGIADSLNQVEVSFLPNEPARLISLFGDTAAARNWTFRHLNPAADYVGALAIPSTGLRVLTWNWPA